MSQRTNGPNQPSNSEGSGPPDADAQVRDKNLEQIGPYKLLEALGEGGMGVVYLAEQTKPVRRKVALKIIKEGMDTKQVVARFEAERQALAVMDHPNIARVFDGGATEAGRPYFVMELVRGVPITEYCDMHKFSVRDRLKLFIGVCQAIQHAHQKGVIHRDIKPSNILVADQDGEPMPKVIDFGIAKAIGQRLTEKTLHTQRGLMIGTPAYMSPEQAEMSGLDVDTRTDIYSLGVILYELLVGDLPFDPKDLEGYQAIVTLRETEPPTPSNRLNSLGERQKQIAERRGTDPGSLRKSLKGDLDWITVKAMEKDRNRRYETANGLALEIQRHLNDEPVLARAPSASYRMGKFARRHKAGVGFAAIVLTLLVGFGLTMSLQAARIAQERDRANQEAATAQQVTEFLVGLFEVSDPAEARGNTITAREILDEGAERINDELVDQPLTQARLIHTLGKVYTNLGLYERAEPLLERALDIQLENHGEDHPDVAQSLYSLGVLRVHQGKFGQAESLVHRSLVVREKVLGPDDAQVAQSVNTLAVLHAMQGNWAEAEPLFKKALAIFQVALGPEEPEVAGALNNLALAYTHQKRYAEAESLLEQSQLIREKTLGADHPAVADGYNNLANVYRDQGKYEKAEAYYRRSVTLTEAVLGPDHPSLGENVMDFGDFYVIQRRYSDAERQYQRALAIRQKALGSNHPDLAETLNGLANLYSAQGTYANAIPLYQRALAIRELVFGREHALVAETLEGYAQLLRKMERADEAEALAARAESIRANAAQ